MKTLLSVRHLTRRGDYVLSFDMHDGLYAMGIAPCFREDFTVNVRGQLHRFDLMPMGWSLSPFHFRLLTDTFVRHLRAADPENASPHGHQTRYYIRRKQWRRARVILYVDVFIFFVSSEEEAFQIRHRLDNLLDMLGLLRHPTKGF
jgi:hypothetical protein